MRSARRDGTADCQMEQLAVFASLRSVQGAGLPCRLGRRFKAFHAMRLHRRPAPPCAAYAAYPVHPLNRDTRLRGYIGSAGLKAKTDTLTAHRERPGERSFFYPFFSQRWTTPFTWPAADRSRPTPSAGTGTWIGEGLPISFRGW